MAEATLKQVSDFFRAGQTGENASLSAFGAEWKQLTEQDKTDLKQGIGDGTLTY